MSANASIEAHGDDSRRRFAGIRADDELRALTRLTFEDLARAFPRATRRIVVFVHGLMGTEFPWSWWSAQNGGTYGTRLASDLDLTPVYVRYNTGRHISENGRCLAELLEELTAEWPERVD